MIESSTCKTCGEWIYGENPRHTYPPAWLVWNPDEGSTEADARTFYARDAEDAAEKWAERDDNDSAEYTIVRGSTAKVGVRAVAGGEVTWWTVTGYYDPVYSAEPAAAEPERAKGGVP